MLTATATENFTGQITVEGDRVMVAPEIGMAGKQSYTLTTRDQGTLTLDFSRTDRPINPTRANIHASEGRTSVVTGTREGDTLFVEQIAEARL